MNESRKEFTDEELAVCKSTDLVQLCSYLGYKPKRVGNFYTLQEMDSVRIKNRKTYTRYSDDTGGSAVDFLINLEGMNFREAVRWLLDYNGVTHQIPTYTSSSLKHLNYHWYAISKAEDGSWRATDAGRERDLQEVHEEVHEEEPEKKPFRLPNANYDYDRVYNYLCGTRKLSREIVQFFVDRRLIYESVKTHNVVFVGRDKNGVARHASLRGTYNPEGKAPFKGVLPGSEAEYSFNLVNPASDRLIVCEAPIDAMSYMQLLWDPSTPDYYDNYLALTGVHTKALERFLAENPHIKEIRLGLDKDDAGTKACKKIQEEFSAGIWKERNFEIRPDQPPEHILSRIPGFCKDWNEFVVERHFAEIEFFCQEAMKKHGELSEELQTLLRQEHYVFDKERDILLDEKEIRKGAEECRKII